ncbi:hypothetical protein RUM43_001848 [Polyplax serrata]|uniref:Peptidase M3A/M3B catalytic domain-containing protein n=1 Tax=Polyplax serrata TaxID=468196 RepID=A0AAN8SJM3_POLSC
MAASIPETPEDVSTNSEIDSTENLPDFSKITPRSCTQIVHTLAQQYDVGFWDLMQHLKNKEHKDENIFKNVFQPLEVLAQPFLSAWGVVRCLHLANIELMPMNLFYVISDRVLQVRNDKYNSSVMYSLCTEALKERGDSFTVEEKQILDKFVWEAELNGWGLDVENRVKLLETLNLMESHRKMYSAKMDYAQNMFRQVIDDRKFAEDCPLDLLRNTAVKRTAPLEGPWVINLKPCVVTRYLEYCVSRESRKHIWCTFYQMLSNRGDHRLNANTEVKELRKTRQQYAEILGYPSYVHLTMKNRMAESVENVQSVLSEILEPAKEAQEKEIYELEKFAYANDFRSSLELWDLRYWRRLHLKNVYDIDELTLKDYFPLGQVLLGLMALCEQLFGIVIEEIPTVEGWNPDVRYFKISDQKTKEYLGGFYIDPYALPQKETGPLDVGHFVAMKPKSKICNSLPLSALIFTFTPPDVDKPSLLYFREVVQLFDKFGQMLQHTLTDTTHSEVSGSSNVEWDAVGMTSHFMRCWLFEKGTLESISGHYETGESIPSHVLDNLCNWNRYGAGVRLCHEIYMSNLDLQLHLTNEGWFKIVQDLWPKHLLFQQSEVDHHPLGFQDVMSGPWAGCFYAGIWSQMLAADVFTAFEEAGFSNHEEMNALGRRYRSTILAAGGSRSTKESFLRFRGRDLKPQSLLKVLQLTSSTSPAFATDPAPALA